MKVRLLKSFKKIKAGSILSVRDMQIVTYRGRHTIAAVVEVQKGALKINLIAVPIDLLEFV